MLDWNLKAGRAAIESLFGEVRAAWAAGDADRFAEAFAEDAIFVAFNGSRLNGRAEIAAFHRHPFATIFRGGVLDFDIVDLRPLTADLCIVASNGGPIRRGERARVAEAQSYVVRRRGDRWEILLFQNTPLLSEGRH